MPTSDQKPDITPDPWGVEVEEHVDGPYIQVTAEPGSDGDTVVICTMGTTCCHGGWGGYANEIDDAYPIAAAPRMLRALELAVGPLQDLADMTLSEDGAVLEEIRAVIALAKRTTR